jgi:hypothetical protein
VIVGIDARRLSEAAIPFEDEPPLPVDAYRVEIGQLAAQFFEMIARRDAQILIRSCVVDHLELTEQAAFEVGRHIPRPDVIHEKSTLPSVPEIDDHSITRRELVYHSTGQGVITPVICIYLDRIDRRRKRRLEPQAASRASRTAARAAAE